MDHIWNTHKLWFNKVKHIYPNYLLLSFFSNLKCCREQWSTKTFVHSSHPPLAGNGHSSSPGCKQTPVPRNNGGSLPHRGGLWTPYKKWPSCAKANTKNTILGCRCPGLSTCKSAIHMTYLLLEFLWVASLGKSVEVPCYGISIFNNGINGALWIAQGFLFFFITHPDLYFSTSLSLTCLESSFGLYGAVCLLVAFVLSCCRFR